MELNPVTSIEWLDWDIISRLGVAAILGLVLGLDREWRGHAAGMRTHGLICVSAAAMVVSIMALYHQLDGPRMDPLRLFEAAGAFIGIIGAGLIVFSKGQLHNLTTAAHLASDHGGYCLRCCAMAPGGNSDRSQPDHDHGLAGCGGQVRQGGPQHRALDRKVARRIGVRVISTYPSEQRSAALCRPVTRADRSYHRFAAGNGECGSRDGSLRRSPA